MAKVNVFITIDTEHSIGGAFADPTLRPVGNDKRVYGKVNGREYGIPLIMDIADRFNIPLTFFVEVFNKYHFGEAETRDVCQYILGRGHDVQLHLHPNFLNFREERPSDCKYSDNLSTYDLATQIELIGEGKELLTRYCGHSPIVFRAGNYGANANTLKALKANGIFIDSSYNAAFPRHSQRICEQQFNDADQLEGVWEFPITNFVEAIPLRGKRFKPLDLNGVGFAEMRRVLEQAHSCQGPRNITFIMHSFSFLKAGDVQYQKCSVRQYVVERFSQLCCHLAEHGETFRCLRFRDIAMLEREFESLDASHVYPSVSFGYSLKRLVQQQLYEVRPRK
ncbi:hypothetical protein [Trichloromonas sp.]|uniref:hypothetical protein n=1 Tax=Trichloromonas sp. TaxID=3069249 RepID=UPI003D81590E